MIANLAGDDVYQLNKKCENGDAGACVNLGYMYEDGIGVSKDESIVLAFYIHPLL